MFGFEKAQVGDSVALFSRCMLSPGPTFGLHNITHVTASHVHVRPFGYRSIARLCRWTGWSCDGFMWGAPAEEAQQAIRDFLAATA